MEIIVLPLLSLVVAICFSGMFAKHNRRRRRLTGMTLEHANPDELVAFEHWRRAARRNSRYADAAAYCASLMWVFPFLLLGLLAFPLLAIRQKKRALALQRLFPALPRGFKWLDAKVMNTEAPDPAAPPSGGRRRLAVAGRIALGVIAVVCGIIAIVKFSKPHPKIDGKPLPEWIEQLSDLDPEVRWNATTKLRHASPEQLDQYRDALEAAAHHDLNVRNLLRSKFP
jgi:hypothetical protein